MRLEWATAGSNVTISAEEGVSLTGIGRHGVMYETGTYVQMQVAILLCLIVDDPSDEPGSICQIWAHVLGPDGTPRTQIQTAEAIWDPGTAPRLVSPERYYTSIRVDFDAVEPGAWVIEVWDDSQTVRLPFRFAEVPSL